MRLHRLRAARAQPWVRALTRVQLAIVHPPCTPTSGRGGSWSRPGGSATCHPRAAVRTATHHRR
eukprot:7377597-Prymnesium_polylepis.1